MARLILLQPYDNKEAGEEITLPGGLASTVVLRGIAKMLDAQRDKTRIELTENGATRESNPAFTISPEVVIGDLKAALAQAGEKRIELESIIELHKSEIDQLFQLMKTTTQIDLKAAQGDCAVKDDRIAKLEAENASLSAHLGQSIDRIADLESDKINLADILDAIGKRLSELEAQTPSTDSTSTK